MKEELNIAEILKDKPKGTKLYSPIFGEVKYDSVLLGDIKVLYSCTDRHFYMDGKFCMNGECLLFPSKEMRDWSKFAWKKGDVLVSNNGNKVLFEKFNNDEYTEFTGRYLFEQGDTVFDAGIIKTSNFKALRDGDKIKDYIAVIEKLFGGKLNLETLEIEKEQIEFKDGDILTCPPTSLCNSSTFIFKMCNLHGYLYYAAIGGVEKLYISTGNTWCGKSEAVRYATEKEKTKLFDALAKEGKSWNAEKKVVEDIKIEHQFKPFERVLVRDRCNEAWRAAFFSYINEYKRYVTTSMAWKYCIPYKGNESLLGTNKDVEE